MALLGALLLGLAGCSSGPTRGVGTTTPSAPSSDPASSDPPAQRAAPARRAGSVLPEAPVAATLPSGTVVPVRAASTTGGLLDVPPDTHVAAWWRGGSRLGDPFGSTLLAAHVDSTTQGLGPFAELLEVERGDRVVLRSAHLTQEFVVRSRRLVPQGPLDDEQWLFASTGPHRLTMVTCAPPYVREDGGYQNLAVVTATPVGAPSEGAAR
ncbi:class F sortase [Nocardioides currus]|uniref:class F sortase n=1 Tax=Nocardioides currus TaxID=2133958 RepID=UPI00105737F4|nr:class F sortase [Nocardioides currus]